MINWIHNGIYTIMNTRVEKQLVYSPWNWLNDLGNSSEATKHNYLFQESICRKIVDVSFIKDEMKKVLWKCLNVFINSNMGEDQKCQL